MVSFNEYTILKSDWIKNMDYMRMPKQVEAKRVGLINTQNYHINVIVHTENFWCAQNSTNQNIHLSVSAGGPVSPRGQM